VRPTAVVQRQKFDVSINQTALSVSLEKLYSEASLGKAYLDEFGIKGFNKQNPNFDHKLTGAFMEAYYGGRSEVRVRHENVEVIHCDFKSEYPTVNALMGLQDLLIANEIGVRRDALETRRFLQSCTLADLQNKETWKKLRGVVLIEPDNDILPFRAQYGEKEDGALSVNIGINQVVSACPAWYTFADYIASKSLDGQSTKDRQDLGTFPNRAARHKGNQTIWRSEIGAIFAARSERRRRSRKRR
jgi:hypothetical protein